MANRLENPNSLEIQLERFFGIESRDRHPLGRHCSAVFSPRVPHIPCGNTHRGGQLTGNAIACQKPLFDPQESVITCSCRIVEGDFLDSKIFGFSSIAGKLGQIIAPLQRQQERRIADEQAKPPG